MFVVSIHTYACVSVLSHDISNIQRTHQPRKSSKSDSSESKGKGANTKTSLCSTVVGYNHPIYYVFPTMNHG